MHNHPLFEPFACMSLNLLSFKTLFLVAITSARRVSELATLRADAPYIQFHPDKVTLYPNVSFLPKVVSSFHVNQPLILPILFPSPSSNIKCTLHSLDVHCALAFYVSRTKGFHSSPHLFFCFHGPGKGCPASSQSISKWITGAITLAYGLAGRLRQRC